MSVQWDPALALGHREIDGQHRELFRHLGALVAAMEQGTDQEIPLLFDLFGEYVVQHFAAEEKAMAATGYPGANVHAAAHARFLREYADLRALYDANGATAGVAVRTRTWLEDWFRSHIHRFDAALAQHLLQRRASTAA